MKKIISIKEFTDELLDRIEQDKGIDCCKEEIKNLANMAVQYMGNREIEVNWKD